MKKYLIYFYDVDHESEDNFYSYYMFRAEPTLQGIKKGLRSHGFPDEIICADDTKIYEVGRELDGKIIVGAEE